jgi:N-acetylglucosamine malate deacetylase 1
MILVLAAHSDDEVLGCGGTIAKYAEEGEDVVSIVFTSGDPTNISHYRDAKEAGIKRRKESIAASKILGVRDTVFLGIPDKPFAAEFKSKKIKQRITKIVKKLAPRIIFTHVPDDPHPIHQSVAKIAKEIATAEEIELYTFTIINPIKIKHRESPRMYIDISSTFKKKREALQQFKSQEHWLIYYKLIAYLDNKLAGLKSGHHYAEVFYKW